ncbi:hypothetical protein SGRIM128S_02264 [Streptomyces griseomycini]
MSRPSSTARTARRATKAWLIGSMALVAGLMTPAYAGPANVGPAAAEEPLKPIANRFMTWNTNGQGLGRRRRSRNRSSELPATGGRVAGVRVNELKVRRDQGQ